MLPDVYAEDSTGAELQRRILIGRADHVELLVLVHHQPRPARAETREAGGVHFVAHSRNAAERTVDRGLEIATRLHCTARRHQFPEERVLLDHLIGSGG